MAEREELFQHKVSVWTVGQLRAALNGVPDEARVRVELAETPGGDTASEQVVFAAGHDADGWLTISAEFPPGEYYRPVE